MALLRWFPWKPLISRVARARGFVDPISILSRFESFAQPMEVKEPLELLRSGVIFHARGLLNTSAIQHNLDWIWPYWVVRQYNPKDTAFIPRAFSITHVNLTNRNWTAVGLPDSDQMPVVDPRGLVMPFWDSFSLDAWVFSDAGERLFPSRAPEVEQRLQLDGGMKVVTSVAGQDVTLESTVEVVEDGSRTACRILHEAGAMDGGWLVIALRPFNPEGVSFVSEIRAAGSEWCIDGAHKIRFGRAPNAWRFSDYRSGDVATKLFDRLDQRATSVHCTIGMATAAALFRIEPGRPAGVALEIPLEVEKRPHGSRPRPPLTSFAEALSGASRFELPDAEWQRLTDAAVHSVVLHTVGDDVFPGPYTYKRFWFRDATFILNALLSAGLHERVERVLDGYPRRQKRDGFFFSQEGEWDSNGEALWIMNRWCGLTGRPPKPEWKKAIRRGAEWIEKKSNRPGDSADAWLLPAGFSAEHLGPNDYYYWDDFWSIGGLEAAASMLERLEEPAAAAKARETGARLRGAVERSLSIAATRTGRPAMPASPYRRLDCGSIGSLAAGYPLRVFAADDERLLDTAEHLYDNALVDGGFYQDIIHSGINPYLTLQLAQIFLRAGDSRAIELARTVARLASPTGQWPEAIHPRTGGGCMGDGHHVWAAAEWLQYVRDSILYEEGERLIVGAGIPDEWLQSEKKIAMVNAPTRFGDVDVRIRRRGESVEISLSGRWRPAPSLVEIRLPHHPRLLIDPASIEKEASGIAGVIAFRYIDSTVSQELVLQDEQ
jgi:hypothetical protein